MQEDELVARPERGRVVTIARHAGLSDVRPDTTVRLDGIARYLQDVADRDAASASVDGAGVWVLRRLVLRIDRTPRFRADLTLATWCSGVGARWAERRTDVMVDGTRCVAAAGLWVHVDTASGAPAPLPAGFDDLWGVSANGRRVRAGLQHKSLPTAGVDSSWLLRVSDLDVLGHVNNAAYWVPVEEELARRGAPRVTRAEMEFRDGLDLGDDVTVRIVDTPDGFACWFRVGDDVRATALVACAP